MPRPAAIIAPSVNGQKYFFTIALARSWNCHNKYPTIANRADRNRADTPKNIHIGNPIKPNQIANNLYGIGVTAVRTIIRTPYFVNIGRTVDSINSGFENVIISHVPTESYSHAPIRYAIAPPTIDPNIAATTIGTARRLFAIMGGVIKTSGGMNKNIDSHTVKINTIHEYAGRSDCFKI